MYVLRSIPNHMPNRCIGVQIIVELELELGTSTLLMEL